MREMLDIDRFTVFFLCLFAAVGALVYLQFFDGLHFIEWTENTAVDDAGSPKTIYRPGEYIRLRRTACIEAAAPGKAARYVVNRATRTTYWIGASAYDGSPGCATKYYAYQLPTPMPDGEYDLHLTFDVQVNAMKTRQFAAPLVRFTIRNE